MKFSWKKWTTKNRVFLKNACMYAMLRLKRILITRATRICKHRPPDTSHSPGREGNVHLISRFQPIAKTVKDGGRYNVMLLCCVNREVLTMHTVNQTSLSHLDYRRSRNVVTLRLRLCSHDSWILKRNFEISSSVNREGRYRRPVLNHYAKVSTLF